MSVFVSYSHSDHDLVDRLCASLVENNVKVWKDNWQISAGESLVRKIQDGIETASYLCVVFSEETSNSEWVKREVDLALSRENVANVITIVPILIEDCKLPPSLGELVYVDFRGSFDSGMKELLAVVGRKYNVNNSGRLSDGLDYYTDYLVVEGAKGGKHYARVDMVAFDVEEEFSILTQIEIVGNEFATKDHLGLDERENIKNQMLQCCVERFSEKDSRIRIIGNEIYQTTFAILDGEDRAVLAVKVRVVRLGKVAKNVVLFNLGAYLKQICQDNGIAF